MRYSLIYIIDMIQVFGLSAFALVCIIGAIANKAWWHIGTAAMLFVLAAASFADAKKEEAEQNGINLKEDHDPYPEE